MDAADLEDIEAFFATADAERVLTRTDMDGDTICLDCTTIYSGDEGLCMCPHCWKEAHHGGVPFNLSEILGLWKEYNANADHTSE